MEDIFVKNKLIKYGLLSVLIALVLSACGANTGEGESTDPSPENNDGTINVMTSFYPMYEFTSQVAGDRANVDLMISGGEDSHSYEPSAQDVAAVTESDAFIYSSEYMETWVPSLLESVDTENLIVARTADGIESDFDETQDPHIWLDPVNVQAQVDIIRDTLIEADPEGKEIYTQNAEDFKQQLQDLHEQYEAELSDAENRTFVVQHEAFGHLANRYDLNQAAIGGLSTEVEPSPARITEIGEIVDEYNVPIIYFQEGADSSIAQTVAEGTGTETAPLYDLEILSEDLQEQGMGYIEAMEENLNQLTKSIQ